VCAVLCFDDSGVGRKCGWFDEEWDKVCDRRQKVNECNMLDGENH
jgi:hypothetical protein